MLVSWPGVVPGIEIVFCTFAVAMDRRQVYIIVVAGGSGRRFGTAMPKQYCRLGTMPVLCHTLTRLRHAVPGARIITVVSPDMRDFWLDMAKEHGIDPGMVTDGGTTRWESVKNAIDTLGDAPGDAIVLVHDGARPLVDADTVTGVIDAIAPGRSAVPVVPVTDSLRLVTADGTSRAVSRTDYRAVVTPQGFVLADLRRAYELPYDETFTDDASVMAAAGMTDTTLVESLPSNIKITNRGDLALASWYIDNGL